MWFELLIIFVGALVGNYFYITRKYGYFKARGIPEVPAHYPFGAYEFWLMLTGKKSFSYCSKCFVVGNLIRYIGMPLTFLS